MNKLLAQVDEQHSAESGASLGKVITEWRSVAELSDGTREMYRGYLTRNIAPVLGDIPIKKLTARTLEKLYAELRRCRIRCDGKPFIEHTASGPHDCQAKKCAPHECDPLAASTVRQIHAVISGALSAAVRWEWLSANPANVAQRPKQTPPQPDPPSPAEAARLIDAAFALNDDWGTLVWLVMTTGIRRGEACALRWSDIDLDEGMLKIRRNYLKRNGLSQLKDTKTHQMRRIALDTETTVLPIHHKARTHARCGELDIPFTDDLYVFVGLRKPDPRTPARQTPSPPATKPWATPSKSRPTSTLRRGTLDRRHRPPHRRRPPGPRRRRRHHPSVSAPPG
jgi:integrase